MKMKLRITLTLAGVITSLGMSASAQTAPPSIPVPPSLKTITIPEPSNLSEFIKNKQAAIVLGKALFWDAQVGSDGKACASCHFKAGADDRVKNQLSPGLLRVNDPDRSPNPDTTFGDDNGKTASGGQAGPNYTLVAEDFPFHQLENVLDRNSKVIYSTNDIAASMGTFAGQYVSPKSVRSGDPGDNCEAPPVDIFHVGGTPTRKVEPRNSPTMINAIFNHRNFWDGRANNIFNGLDPFGKRTNQADPDSGVWVLQDDGTVTKQQIEIDNASLASQAVGPPLSDFEMSCAGRTFAELGRKLIDRAPLALQTVHRNDSVLGKYRSRGGNSTGLRKTYESYIRKAFQEKYWGAEGVVTDQDNDGIERGKMHGDRGQIGKQHKAKGHRDERNDDSRHDSRGNERRHDGRDNHGPGGRDDRKGYSQMEANFSLFFGLAVQLYEATLVSDDSLFDQVQEGRASFTPEQQLGLDVFMGKGKCILCHEGSEFTGASVRLRANQPDGNEESIERMPMGVGTAIYDGGYYNIGVSPTAEDLGVGAEDPYGNTLSFSRQAVNGPMVDSFNFHPERFPVPGPIIPGERVSVDGAFKVPTIRNVELTGPFFHNGGQASLEQVVDFYNRGGDRRSNANCTGNNSANGDTTGFGSECNNLDPDITQLGLSDTEKAALVAFMKSLTDERVRWEQAPFDHPQLLIPNGHTGDEIQVADDGTGRATDDFLEVPAVGSEGRAAEGMQPLGTFLNL